MNRILKYISTFLFVTVLAACGGGGGGSSSGGGGGGGGGAPLTITTASLPNGTVGVAYSVTLQATGGTPPYTWSVSQGSLPSWATLNASTGAITGTPNAAGNTTLTFRVTDSNNVTTQTNSLNLVIAPAAPPPLAITTSSLPNGVVGTAYSATLQASGGTPPYTWSISSGSLPAWASLNASTGAITGTPNASGTTSFTVQVTDSAIASLTQNLSITVNTSNANLGLLSGQYAFVVSGYDSALAGSITVDGKGNITGGAEDIRAPATTLTGSDLTIISGTYTVGSDHRGTLSYTDANGNKFTFALALGGISNGVANQGQMIEFDSNPLEMTGSLALQTKADFSASAFSGAYAFQSSGWDTTPQPDVTVGSFTAGAGAVTNGLFDQNDAGSVTAATAFTGSFGAVDANGRGTFTVTTGSGSRTYEFYVVSAGQLLMINDTSNPDVQSGEALQQTGGPFSASSLSGATIFESRSPDGIPAPNVTFGQITFGSGTIAGDIDQDDGGTVTLGQIFSGGSWSVTSATNGRFLLSPGGAHTDVGYIVAPNFAFMTEESAVTPSVSTIEPQSGGPFSNSSLSGSYYLGTLPSNSPGAPSPGGGQPAPAFNIYSGIFSANGSDGCSLTLDVNSSGVPSSGLTGSDTCSVAANGRITTASGDFVGWMVSPTKFYFLGITQGQPATPNPVLWTIQQ